VKRFASNQHNLSQPDASHLLNQWDQEYQQAQTQVSKKAGQAGQAAAHGIEQETLWAFVALILGLMVAAWGGWAGAASLPEGVEIA
jgi:hypothetical protein